MKHLLATLLFAFVCAPLGAHAQSFSAGSLNTDESAESIAECRSDALTLNQRLVTVRQIINTIIECNKNGEVYDSGSNSCVTPVLSPDHNFRFRTAGSTLELENSDGSFGNAVVIGGAPGADISCEPAAGPPPVSPPVVPPPPVSPPVSPPGFADCTAPWGAAVAHGATVRAYQASSVPDGSTCTSQTRRCSDGSLSGSYTNRDCIVLPPEVTPPAACNLPWGGTIAHGASVTAYRNATAPPRGSCVNETRSCNDGTLSGSFTNRNCEEASLVCESYRTSVPNPSRSGFVHISCAAGWRVGPTSGACGSAGNSARWGGCYCNADGSFSFTERVCSGGGR